MKVSQWLLPPPRATARASLRQLTPEDTRLSCFPPPRATARVPTPLHTSPALTRLCWRMRLRGDSHPPAGRPRGSPLLWTGLESRFIRGIVGATLVVARLDRSMLLSFCLPTVIRQQSLPMIRGKPRSLRDHCKGGGGVGRGGDPCGRPWWGIPCWPTTMFAFTSARSYRPARRRSDHFAGQAVHPVRSSPARPGPAAEPSDQTEALR